MNKSVSILGYVCAVMAVLFWSFNVIVARYFADLFSPWQISFYRWFFASVILLPFCIKQIISKWDVLISNFKILFFLSLTGIVLMNTFSYFAGQTIDAVEMSLIGVMGPVLIIILSYIFLHEKISKLQLVGIGISFLGVLTIILHGHILSIGSIHFQIGDFYMFLLALFFAIYSVLSRSKPKELSQTLTLAFTIFLGLIIITPFFMFDNDLYGMVRWDKVSFLSMLGMGIFNSVLSYLFWNMALEKIGSLKSSMVYYLMPIFSSVEAYFILGEQVYVSQVYGGLLVLLGIFLTNKKTNVDFERP